VNSEDFRLNHDRCTAFKKAIENILPLARDTFDTVHIVANVVNTVGGDMKHLWHAMYALTKANHDEHWRKFSEKNPKVIFM
jgi:hypothetical protein